MSDIYKSLSNERKKMQDEGVMPSWFTTAGWQLFKDKYLYEAANPLEQYRRIAKTAAKHMPEDKDKWEDTFFNMMWSGKLSLSTPVLANMGTDRGLPVSCSGSFVDDSIFGFYDTLKEAALLTKYGFGTSADLSAVRGRGSKISNGGTASGSVPVIKMFTQCMRDVTQGTARRGAWAGYYPLEGDDFDEIADHIKDNPDDCNVGWNVTDSFIARLEQGEEEASRRFAKAMKVKLLTGKGYFFFIDRVNRDNPECYEKFGLSVKASNLCTEITLHSDKDHTYTCVLSSINLAMIEDDGDLRDTASDGTVFLDCVVSEFLEKARKIPGLERAVRGTEKSRALGLGVCGFHTALQKQSIPFESLEAVLYNGRVFKIIKEAAQTASQYMAVLSGEPEWLDGTGFRNSHLLAIAPTASTALIMGGVSQGIEPMLGNAFVQSSAGGELERVNPVFLELAKERGKYSKALVSDINDKYGSVQHLSWLTEHEKLVFRTAYEIDQEAIVRLASQRQQWIDQAQSINLFFSADEDERRIVEVHKKAFTDKRIKSLYYLRTQAGVVGSNGECIACM